MQAPDLPGHGQSADWDGRCDYHDQATDIAADFLAPGTHLIGHSLGATVALRLALNHESALRSLTLIEPVLFAGVRARNPDLYAAHQASNAPFAAAMETEDWDHAARIFTAQWGAGRPWDSLKPQQRANLTARIRIVGETSRALNEDSIGLLTPGRLESLKMPVLLIRGARSEPVIKGIHDALAARIPVVRQACISGAGHMVPLTHPDAVAAEILTFLP